MQPSQQIITNNINCNIQQSQDVGQQIDATLRNIIPNPSQNDSAKRSQVPLFRASQQIDSRT